MYPASTAAWTSEDATRSRARYQAKTLRLNKLETEKAERLQRQKELLAKVKQTKTSI
jgi:electron transport complex protein RnfB